MRALEDLGAKFILDLTRTEAEEPHECVNVTQTTLSPVPIKPLQNGVAHLMTVLPFAVVSVQVRIQEI